MARPRNQTARRSQIVHAAMTAIATRGLAGLRIKDVAQSAGLSAGSVSYYFSELDDLVREVHRHAVDRFYWERLREAEACADPRQKLVRALRSGLPRADGDLEYRVLCEMHAQACRDQFHAQLMSNLFNREVSLYLPILTMGAQHGVFELAAPELTISRNLVALEDSYGLHLLGGLSLSLEEAYGLLISYAEAATGTRLEVEVG
ncbi:TetR family transcriptional regulator [Saxibacter everestensis]|uniref:TetR family transcriptional regulator n=1 Tax=Saxibacter everestensis TaxID=2909229 RepID=A0ABY8QS13_9MICO|nr:TetR family transcriptional regulator [Brevibacteriaceae bacterium ZFBP1038]